MIIIYSALFGRYDTAKSYYPTKDENIKFFMFTEQDSAANWYVEKFDYTKINSDPQRAAREIKTMPHKYLPDHTYSVWVDASIKLNIYNYRNMIERNLRGYDIFMVKHGGARFKRNCSYEEARECMQLCLDNPITIQKQIKKYRKAGFPENYGLCSTGFIIRKNNDKVKKFNELWNEEIRLHSKRDQISVMYSVWRSGIKLNIGDGWSIYNNPYMKKYNHIK